MQREARQLEKVTEIKDVSNSYNMKDMVMPLHMFIDDPIAHEIIHNGATFQVCYFIIIVIYVKDHFLYIKYANELI